MSSKMASSVTAARLQYLDTSARLLSRTAPATSAVLGAQYDDIVRVQKLKTSKSRDREVCGACGNIFVPGRSCQVKLVPKQQTIKTSARDMNRNIVRRTRPATVKPIAGRKKQVKMLVFACGRCRQDTRFSLDDVDPAPSAAKTLAQDINKSKMKPATNGSLAGSIPASVTSSQVQSQPEAGIKSTTANAASKQRAKARKQGTLQALLAKSKIATSSGTAFDLMDFMKQG